MLQAHGITGDELKYHALSFECIASQTLDSLGQTKV